MAEFSQLAAALEGEVAAAVTRAVEPLVSRIARLEGELVELRDRRPTPELDVLIDERGVALLAGVSPETVRAWRQRGGGPPWTKTGPRAIRYSRADVVAWLERRKLGVAR